MGGDVPASVPQQQSSASDVFNPMLHSQINPQIEVRKSPVNPSDPIQSLFQQLTNMTNTQQQQPTHSQHKMHPGNTSEIINHWGGSHSSVPVQQPGIQGQWMSQPWDINEQLIKQKMVKNTVIVCFSYVMIYYFSLADVMFQNDNELVQFSA